VIPSDILLLLPKIALRVQISLPRNWLQPVNGYLANCKDSNIAMGLTASLASPEVYNDIATFLLQEATRNKCAERLKCVAALYDVSIGLAREGEYYLPKYEFNRVRLDFIEQEWRGPPEGDRDIARLVAVIDELHKLGRQFSWAYRFLKKEVCDYICAHADTGGVQRVLQHQNYRRYWGTLRSAVSARLRRV